MNINAVYVEGIIRTVRNRTNTSLNYLGDSDFGRGVKSLQRKAKEKIVRFPSEMVTALNRGNLSEDYSHIYRRKTKWELFLLSGAVCGIEFCYAAETAFVSPILLRLGVKIEFLSMIWCLSPLIGLFLAPILGSLSDSCRMRLGRRRPFIIALSVGILIGLIFVPNGKDIGLALGDKDLITSHNSTTFNNTTSEMNEANETVERRHPWGIVFTVLGTVLLDFCSDACQSPSRTYLLDVTVPEDHVVGLSVFTIMAGLGGSVGYAMGGIDWESTFIGTLLGSHERAVFTIVTILFLLCLSATITSFREVPLDVLCNLTGSGMEIKAKENKPSTKKYEQFANEDDTIDGTIGSGDQSLEYDKNTYGTVSDPSSSNEHGGKELNLVNGQPHGEDLNMTELGSPQEINDSSSIQTHAPSLKTYLKSIIFVPKSIKILCLTNLFCWMSLVSYSLYFTDFVGECVFGGDPSAPESDPKYALYQQGVRFGCWGMSLYSLSCSGYSYIIEALVKKVGAKRVFIGGQLVYTVGMILMAITRHKVSVILLSPTAGVMYATLFTMPYLLVAHYHATETFTSNAEEDPTKGQQLRGIGTDVALVGSMVFLSQFLLSTCMGSIVSAVKSSVATVCAAILLSFCGAICATQVLYLDL